LLHRLARGLARTPSPRISNAFSEPNPAAREEGS
jgi:hypothetical protein